MWRRRAQRRRGAARLARGGSPPRICAAAFAAHLAPGDRGAPVLVVREIDCASASAGGRQRPGGNARAIKSRASAWSSARAVGRSRHIRCQRAVHAIGRQYRRQRPDARSRRVSRPGARLRQWLPGRWASSRWRDARLRAASRVLVLGSGKAGHETNAWGSPRRSARPTSAARRAARAVRAARALWSDRPKDGRGGLDPRRPLPDVAIACGRITVPYMRALKTARRRAGVRGVPAGPACLARRHGSDLDAGA